MLDIKFIRENPKKVEEGAKSKRITLDIEKIVEVEKNYREFQTQIQNLQEQQNKLNKSIQGKPTPEQISEGKELKEKVQEAESQAKVLKQNLDSLLLQIPNLPKDDVKVGKDESENEVVRKFKEPTKFSFTPKDHVILGENLGIIDVERAAKVSGARFAYLKGDAVLLEFALVQLALEILIKEGFIPVVPPVLIRQNITEGLGYWHQGGNEDYYLVSDFQQEQENDKATPNPLYLVGTAEHAVVPMHKDEVLEGKKLPLRYIAFSSAFRREAGTYGKDTKGILRVHQFDKVEMVSFVEKGKDEEELEFLLSLEEKLFQALDIPYQVIKMCTGDLGFPAAKKFDIEAWLPGQDKYREVTSVSTVTDFQSRRLKIRYEKEGNREFVYILNGTAFAIGRTIIAILENYQQEDGSIVIPEVLRKYVGKDVITSKK